MKIVSFHKLITLAAAVALLGCVPHAQSGEEKKEAGPKDMEEWFDQKMPTNDASARFKNPLLG